MVEDGSEVLNTMLDRVRFFLYRQLVSFFTWISFRTQKVHPLQIPVAETVRFEPYAARFAGMPLPGIYDPVTFPAADRAKPRIAGVRKTKLLFRFLNWLAPKKTGPVPTDERSFLRIIYPFFFRKAWPTAPCTPAALAVNGCDVLAEIAVNGPFASYLKKEGEHYVLDLTWILPYECHDGLTAPGGKALFTVRDGKLATVAIERPEGRVDAGAPGFERAKMAVLAGLNEDLTTFRHNIYTHLASLTPFAIATINRLGPNHPIRRLLHHTFDTVLVGNRELGELQLPGPQGFAARIFSHDAPTIAKMAGDHLQRYDFWDFEPPSHFARRGTSETPFDYGYRDNVLRAWNATIDYTREYVALYYVDDPAVTADPEVTAWLDELDRLLTNGIRRDNESFTRERLARLCATLIHHSTVEHDVLNNIVWNYSTLCWLFPTAVPASGQPMDQRRAFDLMATIIGTWKPYNMLLTCEIPNLALDDRAKAVMQRWLDRLQAIQNEMEPERCDLTYPAKWNPSISN